MKSLFSATAALALLVAAGQAGAQTTTDQTGSSAAPAAATSDSSSTAKAPADTVKHQGWSDSSFRYGPDAAANRREAKITQQLNQQELAKVDKTGTSGSMSGTSSSPQKSGDGSSAAGSGSSLGLTSSPSAGSDKAGAPTGPTGDKPMAPDNANPQSSTVYSTPTNGQGNSAAGQ